MQTGYEIGKIYANSDGDGFIVWDEDKMSRLISYSMLFVDVLDCITAEVDDMSNEAREAYHQEYP